MIKELGKSIEKKPVEWLAVGVGVIAMAVVARKLTDTPAHREKLMGNLHTGYDRIRKTGSELWHDSVNKANELEKEAHSLKSSMAPELDASRNNGLLAKVSNHESAVAALMATLVAKGISSYFQWRSVEHASAQRKRVPSSRGHSSAEALDHMTVVELRKVAAEKEIEGRSSMNKDELVEALKQ